MPRKLSITTEDIIAALNEYYPGATEVTTHDVKTWALLEGHTPSTILNRLKSYKVKRGTYTLREKGTEAMPLSPRAQQLASGLQHLSDGKSVDDLPQLLSREPVVTLIPEEDPLFVPFGNFSDVMRIIKSGIFYPVFITGLSGNGKTHSVEQACAQLKREFVRVNVTVETDEDDLLGGFRLANGDTVWHDGPVVDALKRGAVLLLDEIDLASNKIMCLQPLLEGKGVYLKKINEYVKPSPGFQVIATANTKGRGCDDGKFIGTNVLNEAFLERFAITLEQDYPSASVETKILKSVAQQLECETTPIEDLIQWAGLLRASYNQGDIEDVITTRRLINIMRAFSIFGNISKAVEVCTNRFDDDTKKSFREFFDKVSGQPETEEENPDQLSTDSIAITTEF